MLAALAHAVHGALLLGGVVALVVLLVASRPRRPAGVRRPRAVRAQQLALLRSAQQVAPPPSSPWLHVAVVSSGCAAAVHAATAPGLLATTPVAAGALLVALVAELTWVGTLLVRGPGRLLLALGAGGHGLLALGLPAARLADLPTSGVPLAWELAGAGWEAIVAIGVSLVLGSGGFVAARPLSADIVRWSAVARGWLLTSVGLLVVLTVVGGSG